MTLVLSLLTFVLWPHTLPNLENVPCTLEETVQSAAVGWKALFVPVTYTCSNMQFKSSVSLLAFYQLLKVGTEIPTIILLLSLL